MTTKPSNFPHLKLTRGIPLCRRASIAIRKKQCRSSANAYFVNYGRGYWATFCAAFLFFLPQTSWSQHHPLVILKNSLQHIVAVDSSIQWAVDSSSSLTPAKVQTLTFQPFTGTFYLNKNFDYWFRLPVQNATTDSLNALICMDRFTKSDLFFEKKPGTWEHRKAGLWTNFSERSYPPNRHCHPILLAGGQEQTYYLQLSDYFHEGLRSPHFRLMTPAHEKEQRLDEANERIGHQLFKGVFFGILAFFGLYSLLQFFLYHDKAYLFYSCYIVSLILFYLRSLDLQTPCPFLAT